MELHLDCPNRGYLPGALIRGEVEIDSGADGEHGTLSIEFSGRSMIELKAWSIGPGDYGRSTQFLIKSKTVLYEGESCYTDMPAGGYPFLFTFPSKTHNALGQKVWSNSTKYGSPKSWPHNHSLSLLPRSLSYTGGPILSATIEYRLDVKWVSNMRQERKSAILPFDTYRCESAPRVTSFSTIDKFSLRGIALLPSSGEANFSPLSVSDRFHMALGSENLNTKAKFNIETKVATKVIQGSVPLVELCLSYPKQSMTDGVPAVRLRFLTVHLERTTAVRTPRKAASHINSVYFGTNSSLDVVLPEGINMDISDTLGLTTEDLPYDLYTYNLRQTHNLRLYFAVECMGQRFRFQRNTDIDVLAPFYEETPPCFTDI